jgi:hypothetical protein
MESRGLLSCSVQNSPPLEPVLSHLTSVYTLTPFLSSILILLSHIRPRSQKWLSTLHAIRPKLCTNFSYFPFVLHVPPITSSMIPPPWQHLMNCKHYVLIFMLFPHSSVSYVLSYLPQQPVFKYLRSMLLGLQAQVSH